MKKSLHASSEKPTPLFSNSCWKPLNSRKVATKRIATSFADKQIPCFYEAVHVEGFHAALDRERELVDAAASLRKSGIKPSARPVGPNSLWYVRADRLVL